MPPTPETPAAADLVQLDEAGIKALVAEVLDKAGLTAAVETLKKLEAVNPEAHKALKEGPAPRKFSESEKLQKGQSVAQFVRAIAASMQSIKSGQYRNAIQCAENLYGENHPVTKALAASQERQKAVESATGVAGGFAIPDQFSTDFIELLRPVSVIRQARPTILGLDRGTMTIPGFAGGATASYIGEGKPAQKTQPSFRQLKLVSKKLAALVPISNDWLRRADSGADSMIVDDAVAAIAQKSDLAMIRSDGSLGEPTGMRHLAPVANVFAANATVNLANTRADLSKMVLRLRKANCRMLRPAWLMAPRIEEYLLDLADGNGNLVYARSMEERNQLKKAAFFSTTQIPDNLGGGTDESELILADFADVVIGEEEQLIVDMSSDAAYVDGSNVNAAFSLDQTVLRVITLHDLVVRHPESVAVLTGVKWGA